MPTELHDLNARIREKARDELRAELRAAAAPFTQAMSTGYNYDAGFRDKEGKNVTPWTAVDMIVEAVFQIKVKQREQDAIDDFVKKVDGLQSQIDDLTNSFGAGE